WRVRSSLGVGWSPQDGLELGDKFNTGDSVRSTYKMMQVSTPTDLGSTIEPMPAGKDGVILQGPYFAGARLWYRVRTDSSLGWVPQDWLVFGTKFENGETFVVTGKVSATRTAGDFST